MADYKTAYLITRGHEGGTSDHAKDRGGFTYKGISRKNWPTWEGWFYVDRLDSLSKEDEIYLESLVDKFYKVNFWDRISLTSINNQKIANELFDTAVNAHTKTAVTFLQRALNLLNQEGKLYPDIAVDGILGIKTVEITNAHPYPEALLKLLNGLQLAYYVAICERDPTQEAFLRGWLKRTI